MGPFFETQCRNLSLSYGMNTRFDILNRLGVDHQCDRQTDRHIKWPLAIARSNIQTRAKKCLCLCVLCIDDVIKSTVLLYRATDLIDWYKIGVVSGTA